MNAVIKRKAIGINECWKFKKELIEHFLPNQICKFRNNNQVEHIVLQCLCMCVYRRDIELCVAFYSKYI